MWNPYSLGELLAFKGTDSYIACIDKGDVNCEAPQTQALAAQGVELLQVISRCRANYQQTQWDEGARFMGLFSAEEWVDGISVDGMQQSSANRKHRLRLVEISSHVLKTPDKQVVDCFAAALERGDRSPNCMREALHERARRQRGGAGGGSVVEDYFQYELAIGDQFADIDACRVYSGSHSQFSKTGASMPLFLWTSSSENQDSVATKHLLKVRCVLALTGASLALRARASGPLSYVCS